MDSEGYHDYREDEDAQRLTLPAAVLLDLESRARDDEADESLLYFYPDTEPQEELSNKIRGMLLAIRGVVGSIAGQKVRVVTMDHLDFNQTIRVAYVQLGEVLLALMLPAKLSEFLAYSVAQDCSQLMQFALGPSSYWWATDDGDEEFIEVDGSFTSPSCTWVGRQKLTTGQQKVMCGWVRNRLDIILQCYFYEVHSREWLHSHVVTAFELGVPYAVVVPDLQLRALELLTNVEVATPSADERLSSPPLFYASRVGCLIHSGRLIASHMDVRQTKEVWRMCWALSLFHRTPQHPSVVLLQDGFLAEALPQDGVPRGNQRDGPGSPGSSSDGCQDEGPDGRRVALLVVGVGVSVLVVMLTPREDAQAADLQGSFLIDLMTHDLIQFQEAEAAALKKLRYSEDDEETAQEASRLASPKPPVSSPRVARDKMPTESLLLHHISYNGVNGVLLATDSPPGELASNLAGDFIATAFHLHSLFTNLRQSTFHGTAGRSGERLEGTPKNGSPFAPFSPFSNSPGPQWENIGTPMSLTRSAQKEPPLTLSLSTLINAAGSLREGEAKRLGQADPTAFMYHQDMEPLRGVHEICVGLRRTDIVARTQGRTAPDVQTKWWVTGRVDSSGRELFICHQEEVPLSAVDMTFQIGFGTFC